MCVCVVYMKWDVKSANGINASCFNKHKMQSKEYDRSTEIEHLKKTKQFVLNDVHLSLSLSL